MYSVSYRDLHKEHMNWISSIKIWKDGTICLQKLCSSQNHSPNIATLKEINNKISQSGYESLSKEEKQKLFNASKK